MCSLSATEQGLVCSLPLGWGTVAKWEIVGKNGGAAFVCVCVHMRVVFFLFDSACLFACAVTYEFERVCVCVCVCLWLRITRECEILRAVWITYWQRICVSAPCLSGGVRLCDYLCSSASKSLSLSAYIRLCVLRRSLVSARVCVSLNLSVLCSFPPLICVMLDCGLITNYSLSGSTACSCSLSHHVLHLPLRFPLALTSFYGGHK